MDALGGELGMDPRDAIGLPRGLVDGGDTLGKSGVDDRTFRRPTALPGVEATARHPQRSRHHLDRKISLVRGHEVEDLEDVTSL